MTQITGSMIGKTAIWLSIVSQLFGTRLGVLLQPYGLTVGQLSILSHIVRRCGAGQDRVSDIAAAVEVNQPAVTKALYKFQTMGLVDFVDNQQDRRSKTVVPRPEASVLLEQIYQGLAPDFTEAFRCIGDENIEPFAETLQKLGKWLDDHRLSSKSND